MLEKGTIIVIATKDEVKLVKEEGYPILITGVGAINVFNALKDIPRDTPIVNYGYAGSPDIPIGTECAVARCDLYHPNVDYAEPSFSILPDGVTCHTLTDFGGDAREKGCVFDMELAFILAMGFKNVVSIKTISDNISYEEYENTIGKE